MPIYITPGTGEKWFTCPLKPKNFHPLINLFHAIRRYKTSECLQFPNSGGYYEQTNLFCEAVEAVF